MVTRTGLGLVGGLALLIGLAPASASDISTPQPTPSANSFEETRADCFARCRNDYDRCIAAGYEKWICDDQKYACEQGQCARLTAEPTPTPALTPKP